MHYSSIMPFSFVQEILLGEIQQTPAIVVKCTTSEEEFLVISLSFKGVKFCVVTNRRFFRKFQAIELCRYQSLHVMVRCENAHRNTSMPRLIFEAANGPLTRSQSNLFIGYVNGISMDCRVSNIGLFTSIGKGMNCDRTLDPDLPGDLVQQFGIFKLPSGIKYNVVKKQFCHKFISTIKSTDEASTSTNASKLVEVLESYIKNFATMEKRPCAVRRQHLTEEFFDIIEVATKRNSYLFPPSLTSKFVQSDDGKHAELLLLKVRSKNELVHVSPNFRNVYDNQRVPTTGKATGNIRAPDDKQVTGKATGNHKAHGDNGVFENVRVLSTGVSTGNKSTKHTFNIHSDTMRTINNIIISKNTAKLATTGANMRSPSGTTNRR